jgi:hypothetical protein
MGSSRELRPPRRACCPHRRGLHKYDGHSGRRANAAECWQQPPEEDGTVEICADESAREGDKMTPTWPAFGCRRAAALLMVALASPLASVAAPIPPADFTFDVATGGALLPDCSPFRGLAGGGSCGSETSGPGFAATSGGIGTDSYLPLTPGGTVLGTGTAVDALSNWSSGGRIRSSATLSYSFEATGPAGVNFIPVDVLSKGLTAIAGNATASLSLVIRDAGTDANIPPGTPDPDPHGPLLDLSAHCAAGVCVGDWGTSGQLMTDLLCVVNGDNYVITISAVTSAGKGAPGAAESASAVLDPVIKLDPPYPTSCPVKVSLSSLALHTSPGTSTGTSVPEPAPLGLAAIAAFGFIVMLLLRRRRVAHARR